MCPALRLLEAGQPAYVRGFFKPAKPPVALETFRQSGTGAAVDFLKGFPSLIWHNLIMRNLRVLFGRESAISPDARC